MEPDTSASGRLGTIDAGADEGLPDAASSRLRRHTEHPDRGGIGVVYLAARRLPVDEGDGPDGASADLGDQDLTARHSARHVAQVLFVGPDVAERSIRLDHELTDRIVLVGSHRPDRDRTLSCHATTLSDAWA